MLNPGVYGSSVSPMLGAINTEDLVNKFKDDYGDIFGDINLEGPSKGIAEDIGEELAEAHGEAAGQAAGAEVWEKAKPFVWVAIGLLGFIAVVSLRKKKR